VAEQPVAVPMAIVAERIAAWGPELQLCQNLLLTLRVLGRLRQLSLPRPCPVQATRKGLVKP
jgi:hypothetical protein